VKSKIIEHVALAELPLALACGYEKLINMYGFSQMKLK